MISTAVFILGTLVALIFVVILFLRNGMNRCPESTELIKSTKALKKTVLITGANSGIGLATAQTLTEIYETVIMACRNIDAANGIAKQLKSADSNKKIIVEKLDLSSMEQIRQCCKDIRNNPQISSIDTIICNAGVMPKRKGLKSKDGYELATGVNHLGHMLLVMELKDLLFKNGNKNDPSRLIVVSGDIYKTLKWTGNLPKLNDDNSWDRIWNIDNEKVYQCSNAYSMSKLCNIWFANEFARRYCDGDDRKCITVSLHPGVGKTDLGFDRDDQGNRKALNWFLTNIAMPFFAIIGDTPGMLAYTQCWCAVTDYKNLKNGGFYRGTKLYDVLQIASSKEFGEKMWNISVHLIEKVIKSKMPC